MHDGSQEHCNHEYIYGFPQHLCKTTTTEPNTLTCVAIIRRPPQRERGKRQGLGVPNV